MAIATTCADCEGCTSLMVASESSARDPIFYRWHKHVEELLQDFRDKKLPAYEQTDFPLSDGVEVKDIHTILKKRTTGSKKTLKNILSTFKEESNVAHHKRDDAGMTGDASVLYTRLNHLPFEYKIVLKNPQRSTKKVIVRIWLAYLPDNDEK